MRTTLLLLLAGCTLEGPFLSGETVDSAEASWGDEDGDGYVGDDDCAPEDFEVNPGAPERCDGVDHDCDGAVNETTSTDARPWHPDRDADGYGDMFLIVMACAAPRGFIADGSDCGDDSPAARPGGTEV